MRLRSKRDSSAAASIPTEHAQTMSVSREIVPPALWRSFVLVWLLFLYYPLLALLGSRPTPFQLAMTLAGVGIFVGLYLRLALPLPFEGESSRRFDWHRYRTALALATLLAAAIALLTLLASVDWLWFFIFISIALGAHLPPRAAAIAIAVVTAIAIVIGVATLGWVYALRIALPVAVVGFGMIGVGSLVTTTRALRTAREEIARLAVAEERLRFARDLHDTLGHSLALIALKSEVAESLAASAPEQAAEAAHAAAIAARAALREVRAVVTGQRQPNLAGELRAAEELLSAAGITPEYVGDDLARVTLPGEIDAALAWAVREGVTNVVRHSHARQCRIHLWREDGAVFVDVWDDGRGEQTLSLTSQRQLPDGSGHGLRGLRERVAALGGSCEAGSVDGGFQLRVTLPVVASTADAATGAGSSVREGEHA